MPGSLSHGIGTETQSEVMHAWTPIDSDYDNYLGEPAKSPRDALQPLIDKFRSLQYISRPHNSGDDTLYEVVGESYDVTLPDDASEEVRRVVEKMRWDWQRSRGLKAIYLKCGWRPDRVDQSAFDHDEFLAQRARHLTG